DPPAHTDRARHPDLRQLRFGESLRDGESSEALGVFGERRSAARAGRYRVADEPGCDVLIMRINRRSVLAAPLLAGFAPQAGAATDDTRVFATADSIPHTPEAYTALLAKLSAGVQVDDYSNGGTVAQLEAKVAADLGKETAVWLPTGTLANHLAVRLLAGDRRRGLGQQGAHLYNDFGGCWPILRRLEKGP